MFNKLLRSLILRFCLNEYIETEVPCRLAERIYYDFPVRQWQPGSLLIALGQGVDKELVIDLSSEDTPHIQIVGIGGSGKTNLLRAIAYCLVMQDAFVSVCGQFTEYKDLTGATRKCEIITQESRGSRGSRGSKGSKEKN